MPAPMESFAFEPLNGRLTVWQSPIPLSSPELPSPSTTTVIEPQLVTVPPACFLLSSTIKRCVALFSHCVSAARRKEIFLSEIQQEFHVWCFAFLGFSFFSQGNRQLEEVWYCCRIAFGNSVIADAQTEEAISENLLSNCINLWSTFSDQHKYR